MNILFLATGIVLVIVALVIRDQTEFKLGRLRAQLMGLRSEEQRLNEERKELERMVAQAGDSLMRADQRQRSAQKTRKELVELMEDLGVELELEDLVKPGEAQEEG